MKLHKFHLFLLIIYGSFSNNMLSQSISLRKHVVPLIACMYVSSKVVSVHTNYTLMQIKKKNKVYYGACIAIDSSKIILALWVARYIKNFTLTKFFKSSLKTMLSIRYWI